MKLNDKIYVAGHKGLVGSAIIRLLEKENFSNIIVRSHNALDLTDQNQVRNFFQKESPDYVILAAAKVGGIYANNEYPADFIFQNLMIQSNVINSSFESKVKRLLFLGSTCIYPKAVKQPMRESALLTGILEPTNEPYAIAKIAGIKLCESYNRQYGTDYRSVMPTNLYGINDNFHALNSHVVPALIRRIHEAKMNNFKEVIVWGSGKVMRELMYVDDLASACLFVLKISKKLYLSNTKPMLSHVNIGTGKEISIFELAELIKKIIGYRGHLVFDATKPDGPPRKLIDTSRISKLGWQSSTDLEIGITKTYDWFKQNADRL